MPDMIIEPKPGVEPVAAETTPAPAEGGAELPDELMRVPAFQALTAGQPAAFSTNLKSKDNPEVAGLLKANAKPLMEAGFGFYRSLGGDLGVVFNQLYITGDQIQQADKSGQLPQTAPDFDALNQQVAQSGEANPVLSHSGQPPESAPNPQPPALPQAASGMLPPPPAASQNKLNAARTSNLTPKGPIKGSPRPGAGRLLNSLLTPAI